jgi:hypothetical protein
MLSEGENRARLLLQSAHVTSDPKQGPTRDYKRECDISTVSQTSIFPLGTAITIHDATRMITTARQQENLSTRQRWISLSEFVVGGAIVIAHNVYTASRTRCRSFLCSEGFPSGCGTAAGRWWACTSPTRGGSRSCGCTGRSLDHSRGPARRFRGSKNMVPSRERAGGDQRGDDMESSPSWFGSGLDVLPPLARDGSWRHCLCPVGCSAMGTTTKVPPGILQSTVSG